MQDKKIYTKRKHGKTLAEDFENSVREMMEAYGQADGLPTEPMFPDQSTRFLRTQLIVEEFGEFLEAEENNDLVEVADAFGDLLVVIQGAALAYGIDLPSVLSEIQRSNMSKVDPQTGTVTRRADGKVLKPEGYSPPDIEGVM